MDREPQTFEEALERTSKNARAIGDQNLKFVSGELNKTSQAFPATVDREPQKFEEALERTSKTARAIGDRELPDRVAKLDELEGGRLPK